jgi:hypothetical protein
MTPLELFDYADRFARAAENADKGTQYPTVRDAAKRFRVTQGAIEEACYDYQGSGYLGLIVGFKTYAGRGEYATKGACQVEAYQ